MGKKKHKKKQKQAAQDEQASPPPGPSPLHRIGQALLDQARSPAGRQLLATGLIVAASALARETGRRTAEEPAPGPGPAPTPDPQPSETTQGPQSGGTTRSAMPEMAAFAGMALSALDQFLHRPSPDKKD